MPDGEKKQASCRKNLYNYINRLSNHICQVFREELQVNKPEATAIKLITFDLGNVLVRVDHMEFCRRLAVLTHVGAEEIFDYVFNSPLEPGYDTGMMTSREFYGQIMAQFHVALEFDRFARWWNSLFSPMPDMAEVVARLAGNFPLFLLSNTNALHFDYIQENYPVLKHFSYCVLSYKVGSRKPEKGIYEHLLQQAGVTPEQILFIDDKMPFVAAAQEYGIQAWQFTSGEALKQQLLEHGLW
jgi:HAD superfamily hydrolase (TIGR01509 family)